jgi:hypothetical protein
VRLRDEGKAFADEVKAVQEGLWLEWLEAAEAVDRSPSRIYEGTGKQ